MDSHLQKMGYDLDKKLGEGMCVTLDKKFTAHGAQPFTDGELILYSQYKDAGKGLVECLA